MINKLRNINPYFKPILESLSVLAGKMDVRIYLVGGVVGPLCSERDIRF